MLAFAAGAVVGGVAVIVAYGVVTWYIARHIGPPAG